MQASKGDINYSPREDSQSSVDDGDHDDMFYRATEDGM